MMKTCIFRITTEAGFVNAGTVTFDGARLTPVARPGYETLIADIMKESVIAGRRKLFAADDPAIWFENLPREYHGSYLNAYITESASRQELWKAPNPLSSRSGNFLEDELMDTNHTLAAPPRKFRLIGVDTFEGPTSDYLIGDFGTLEEAKAVAAERGGPMNPVYVYGDFPGALPLYQAGSE
jgi:hypothetical protein